MTVRTAKEIEAEFRKDLAALLQKYKAELHVTDDGAPFGLHHGVAEVYIAAEYDSEGQYVSEGADFRI